PPESGKRVIRHRQDVGVAVAVEPGASAGANSRPETFMRVELVVNVGLRDRMVMLVLDHHEPTPATAALPHPPCGSADSREHKHPTAAQPEVPPTPHQRDKNVRTQNHEGHADKTLHRNVDRVWQLFGEHDRY